MRGVLEVLLLISQFLVGCVFGGIFGLGGLFVSISSNSWPFAWWIHGLAIIISLAYCWWVEIKFFHCQNIGRHIAINRALGEW